MLISDGAFLLALNPLDHAEIPATSLRRSAFIGGAPYNSRMGSKILYDVLVPK